MCGTTGCASARPIDCVIDEKKGQVVFRYVASSYDENIQLVKSNSIDTVHKMKNVLFCIIKNVGVRSMYYNHILGCGHPANLDTSKDIFVEENDCHRSLLNMKGEFFDISSCKRSRESAKNLTRYIIDRESDETFVYC